MIKPLVLAVWILCALFLAVIHLYRSRLTRDEEDQLFLDESFNHVKSAQAAIATKVEKIEPLVKTSHWLLGAATMAVVGYFIYEIFFIQL